jgi:hypothetical protein
MITIQLPISQGTTFQTRIQTRHIGVRNGYDVSVELEGITYTAIVSDDVINSTASWDFEEKNGNNLEYVCDSKSIMLSPGKALNHALFEDFTVSKVVNTSYIDTDPIQRVYITTPRHMSETVSVTYNQNGDYDYCDASLNIGGVNYTGHIVYSAITSASNWILTSQDGNALWYSCDGEIFKLNPN